MKTDQKAIEQDAKAREGSYPLYSLEEALKVAEAVRDLGGARTPVPKAVLAKQLDYAQKGPSFFQRVGAAKCYKLISGWGTYSLTPGAQLYFFPTTEADKRIALIQFLRGPAPFEKLSNRFDGGVLPSVEMIGNILHNDSQVPISWKDRVAAFFVKSAQFAGVLDTSGNYRITLQPTIPIEQSAPEIGQPATSRSTLSNMNISEDATRSARKIAEPQPGNTVWAFPFGGQYVRLETPADISAELWQKLNAYVQILKPAEAGDK